MKYPITYSIVFAIFFTCVCSCNREESAVPESPAKFYKIAELDGRDRGDCFDFVYPLIFNMPDASKITLFNAYETDRLRAWYERHPREGDRPQFQFPLQIIPKSGVVSTVADESSLRAIYEECSKTDNDTESCFELIYPVVYVMPDGSLIPVDYKEAAEGEFSRWYRENPEIDAPPVLQYPVKLLLDDASAHTISNEAEMRELMKSCD